MANSPQAKKRARQQVKNRSRNMSLKSETRTFVKRVIKAVVAKNLELAQQEFNIAKSKLDKLANKKIIHANKAARLKSRLTKKIKLLQAA